MANLIGQKFGRLTVIERAETTKGGKITWVCRCDCGNLCEKTKTTNDLRNGKVQSCGCLHKEKVSEIGKKNKKYTQEEKRIYTIWNSMIQRCYNKKSINYKYYGKKGIEVNQEWLNKENGFINFYNWAIVNNYKDYLTLDRINNEGNYEPNNCRWEDYKVQENNRSNNRVITINNISMTLAQWADKYNLNPMTLRWRIENNWEIEDLFIKPDFNNKLRRSKKHE